MQQRAISEPFQLGKRGPSTVWEGRGVPWPGRYLLRPQSMKTSAVCVAVGWGECKEERMVWLLSYRGDQD